MYMFLLLLIFLVELMIGILAYVYRNQLEVDLKYNLDNTFIQKYGISLSETLSIDKMQQEYKCCGATSFENWDKSRWRKESNTTNLVPDSCCKTIDFGCGQRNHPRVDCTVIVGCVHKFTEELKQQLVIIFAVGLGFSVIQIFGMVLSCFLYFKLKGDDE
uniref:Uncharacterized protein n=1 Tax=Rhodnius prolixus TaxID=13249 RepID=T1I7E1_RHOPR